MIRSLKVRLYLTDEQEILARKHIGCSRFIWNYMLAEQIRRRENGEKHLSRFDMIKLLTPLKKQEEYKFLNEVSNTTLQIICSDLNQAYQNFFSVDGKQMNFHNINKSKRVRTLKHKLKHLQRKAARKYRTNGSYEKTNAILKTEAQIKEIHYHLANIRRNYIHQTTHKLTELYPEVITMEDLNVSGMMKNRHLARAIAEQCFCEFRRQMEYKCEAKGIKLQFADRFYPSSKTCSCCGHIKKDLKLKDRTYICSECGLKIDRDFNAALNLERYIVH